MALISCSECRREISDKAAACPGCGAPVQKPVSTPLFGACPCCGASVSMKASGCEKCKAIFSDDGWKPGPAVATERGADAVKQEPVKSGSAIWKWVLGVPASLFVLVMIIGSCAGNTPEGKAQGNDRSAIEVCWEEQGRKSLDPSSGRFVASVCEKMERDFRDRWGFSP